MAARGRVGGIEPLTCRGQEARPDAPDALAATMTWAIASTALVTLGLSGDQHLPQRQRKLIDLSDRANRTGQAK